MQETFEHIFKSNFWRSDESVSGNGSTLAATEVVREALPTLLRELEICTLLDIPCGDFNWMKRVDLGAIDYIGADIVPGLVEWNSQEYENDTTHFVVMDITRSPLPNVDLILSRDILGHLSNTEVRRALRNIKSSGSKYLLATTFTDRQNDGDIRTGEWRPLNLMHMWGMPEPIKIINEHCTAGGGAFADKSLALWRLEDVEW